MNKLQNMMIGIALGDAFGAGYEFAFKERSKFHDVDINNYRKHNNPNFNHKQGMYTDDTQMSIGVAKLLVSGKQFNHINLANSFVDTYKQDPIKGYARGFQAFLNSISDGNDFLSKIRPDSKRNGAAMRAVPIGLVNDLEKVIKYAKINAHLTHNNSKGISSSVAVALLSHNNFYNGENPNIKKDIIPIIEKIDEETANYLQEVSQMKEFDAELLFGIKHKDKGVPCNGMRTAGAVMHILYNYNTPKDILIESVRLGGDTDSVASIALGIHMINDSFDNLPKPLYDKLTNYKFGKDYLLELGNKLNEKYN